MFSVIVNDAATIEFYTSSHTLALHDALSIGRRADRRDAGKLEFAVRLELGTVAGARTRRGPAAYRPGHPAAAPHGGRFRRAPTHRARRRRDQPSPPPPDRVQAHRTERERTDTRFSAPEHGGASWRESGWQNVEIQVVGVPRQKKQ